MPTIDTFSPVRPSVRRGIGASAACDICGQRDVKTLVAAALFKKSRRSIRPPCPARDAHEDSTASELIAALTALAIRGQHSGTRVGAAPVTTGWMVKAGC